MVTQTHSVPFASVRPEGKDLSAVIDVVKSGQFIQGGNYYRFAEEWAKVCGAKYCIPVKSGCAALTIALKTLYLPRLTYALMPAFSFAATATAVMDAGVRPLYVDVHLDGSINWSLALKAVEVDKPRSIRVIVPVHLFGRIDDIPEEFTKDDSKFFVLEDAAQAHTAQLCGHAAAFSFYPSKNLGAFGDAGAIVTNAAVHGDIMQKWVSYGDAPGQKYQHNIPGVNERMDEIQAAVLLSRLERLEGWTAARRVAAEVYREEGVAPITKHRNNVYHLFPILCSSPAIMIRQLAAAGIEARRHYPYVLPGVVGGRAAGEIPVARRLSRQVVTLPMHPDLSVEQVRYVAKAIREFATLRADDNVWELK